ncbi:MAG TPA: transglutaminaseTgpA domain-containing protein [bacterium]|nr:transglutaminaseTgpA domain-containing protein [bacterium]
MKITPVGKAALLLIFLTLWNAVNGGLNTLYMVYSAVASALLFSLLWLWLSSALIEAEATLPDQIFAGDSVILKVKIRNRSPLPAFGIAAVTRSTRTPLGDIGSRSSLEAAIPYRFTRRGITDVTDLCLELSFPFNLFVKRRAIAVKRTAVLPRLIQISGKPRMQEAASEEVPKRGRGMGDELWGIREFRPGDDLRLISWKLSAKAGRTLVREFADMVGDRVTVRAQGRPFGDAAEMNISEAASTARFFIDEGAEVRLVTDEGDTGFGRGLLHLQTIFEHLSVLGEGAILRGTGRPEGKSAQSTEGTTRPHPFRAMWVFAMAAAASLWLARGMDPVTPVLVTLFVALGIFFDRTGKHPVPPLLLNAINVAVIAAVLFVDIPLAGLLPGLTHLLSWALMNRLISRKGPRDSMLIALISFLLFLLVSWQTIDPAYFAAFVAFFAAAGAWATLTSDSVRTMDGRRALALAASVLIVFAVSGAVFAATPRVENPRFAKMMRQLGLANMVIPELSIVKLADKVTLGVFDDVRVNSRRVMQVKVAGLEVPDGAALYVRGGALDRFDGESWTRSRYDFPYIRGGRPVMSQNGKALYQRDGDAYTAAASRNPVPATSAEFFVYPMATSVIFSIGDPTAVEGDVSWPSFDLSGTAYSASNFEKGGRYIVSSDSFDIRIDRLVEGYGEVLTALYMDVPNNRDGEVLRRIAAEVAGDEAGPEAKARAIERHFHGDYVYSYLGRHGRQSLAEFLTETKAANCEYYATAMALMLRLQGVPARLAIGYVSTDWKQVGDYFDVRNSDGHAWVEAYVPGRGWVSFDPTPDVVGFPDESFPLGRELYSYLLGMQMSWYRYVIGYDFYLQQDAFASFIAMWREIVGTVAVALLLVAIAAFFGFILHANLPRKLRGYKHSPAAAAWLKAEKNLSRYGFRRMGWETPLEFAARVALSNPALELFKAAAIAYYRWRYAGEGEREARAALSAIGIAAKRHGDIDVKVR